MAKEAAVTKQPGKSKTVSKRYETSGGPISVGFDDDGWGPEMGLWRPLPTDLLVNGNRPSGLEALLDLDYVFIVQYLELIEIITSFDIRNRYLIRDDKGQNVLFAAESSSCCCRFFFNQWRRFSMHFYNATRQEVFYCERPFRNRCCFFRQEMDIFLPPETMITSIMQKGSCCKPIFVVYGKGRSRLLKIFSPCCHLPCTDINFKILDATGKEIGSITKKWGGVLKELVTKADNFRVTFPRELDVNLKATIISAAMLIDFNFFERD